MATGFSWELDDEPLLKKPEQPTPNPAMGYASTFGMDAGMAPSPYGMDPGG